MQFNFDLISDLHVETWDQFDWSGQATSPYCVVAGDVARDRTVLRETLEHLGQCYHAVFYIDGNDEHCYTLDNLNKSYRSLAREISQIKNVVYLQDNVAIVNGVALLATNGWWSYDFDPLIDPEQSRLWHKDKMNIIDSATDSIIGNSYTDTAYLINSVKKLQTHKDVKSIVIITHTVPAPELIKHDIQLQDSWRFNCMGNRYLKLALREDTEKKINTWCFGHYHMPVDRLIGDVRFVNNCRGRGNTDWSTSVYYPRRISIEI